MNVHVQYNGQYAGFLFGFLCRARSLAKIKQLRQSAGKRNHRATEDALWDAYFALERQVKEDARELTLRGQLLLAWEGTNALESCTA